MNHHITDHRGSIDGYHMFLCSVCGYRILLCPDSKPIHLSHGDELAAHSGTTGDLEMPSVATFAETPDEDEWQDFINEIW